MSDHSSNAGRMPSPVEVEINSWFIVLVGSFNPAIFHPAWFNFHGVAHKGIADSAQIEVIHRNASIFRLGDIQINVEPERFQVQTENAPEIRLLDLVSKVFGDILPHTKITSFGINRSVHFRAAAPEKRNDLFRELAPLENWGDWGRRIADNQGKISGGLESISMKEMLEDQDSSGHMWVRVEPSVILAGTSGIFMTYNRHFGMKNLAVEDGAAKAISKLNEEFAPALEMGDKSLDNFFRRTR